MDPRVLRAAIMPLKPGTSDVSNTRIAQEMAMILRDLAPTERGEALKAAEEARAKADAAALETARREAQTTVATRRAAIDAARRADGTARRAEAKSSINSGRISDRSTTTASNPGRLSTSTESSRSRPGTGTTSTGLSPSSSDSLALVRPFFDTTIKKTDGHGKVPTLKLPG